MKFRQPAVPGRNTSGDDGFRPMGRPDWLLEWIANLGRYVELACGCKEDLNSRVVIIMCGENAVLCDRCSVWTHAVRPITVADMVGIAPYRHTDVPLF